jgi:hypothetical protein
MYRLIAFVLCLCALSTVAVSQLAGGRQAKRGAPAAAACSCGAGCSCAPCCPCQTAEPPLAGEAKSKK